MITGAGARCSRSLVSVSALADGVAQMHAFFEKKYAGARQLEQRVIAQSGGKAQVSSAALLLQRPGQFRWSYEKPYVQLLVRMANRCGATTRPQAGGGESRGKACWPAARRSFIWRHIDKHFPSRRWRDGGWA
ncbi:MAG: outer-membrane lipoprotein carrier protein LolA [Rhodocyclaceae bacterium]|nr:outer-membrane lipoprotein carrier protein LolA [Rhodocyclaceae bacterium]